MQDSKHGLRVLMITQGIYPILSHILESRHELVGIVEAAPRGYSRKKIFCQNHKEKAKRFAKFLAKTISIRPLGLKRYSSCLQIPYYFMGNGCDISLEEWISDKTPDIIVVYSMSELLKKNIWALPKYRTINIHPSLLPKYRGPNPLFWIYRDMDLQGGVTVHYIDDGEDTGDILEQEVFPIRVGERPRLIREKANEIGARLLVRNLDQIALGREIIVPQPKESPTPRARNVSPSEMWGFIDWENWSIERLFHYFRYLEPFLHNFKGFNSLPWFSWEVVGFRNNQSRVFGKTGEKIIKSKSGEIFFTKRIHTYIQRVFKGVFFNDA